MYGLRTIMFIVHKNSKYQKHLELELKINHSFYITQIKNRNQFNYLGLCSTRFYLLLTLLVFERIPSPPLLGLLRPFCFGWIAKAQFYFGNGDSTATIHSFYSAVSCLCRGQWIHWWKGRIGDSTPQVSTLSFLINQEPEVLDQIFQNHHHNSSSTAIAVGFWVAKVEKSAR